MLAATTRGGMNCSTTTAVGIFDGDIQTNMSDQEGVTEVAPGNAVAGDKSPEGEILTPQHSFTRSRSLSLDSLLDGAMFSPLHVSDATTGEATSRRDAIGSLGAIGANQLSPILRPNESSAPHRLTVEEINAENETMESTICENEPTLVAQTDESVPTHAALETVDSEESTPDSNDSFVSTSSTREAEIQLAQQQAGASGLAFIQGLRGAAHRRKMNLTRSRDSLAAKERERREEDERLAAERARLAEMNQNQHSASPDSPHEFRARPLPKSNRMSGVSGLPKVVKRPVTTPFSPLLGARRKSMPVAMESKGSTNLKRIDETETTTFKARPFAKNVVNEGGRAGVPKVPKRPTTVPFSPLLGARRPKNLTRRHSMNTSGQSRSTDSDSMPLGLEFVPSDAENSENVVVKTVPRQPEIVFKEFQLQSTVRAQKRAVFDEYRKQRWEERQQEELEKRRERIRRLERELGELRWEL